MENALKQKLIAKAEELQWSVNIYNEKEWEFEKYSPAGEDFVFSIAVKNVKDVWQKVREYANNFDTEEHVKMWAQTSGTKGVPSIRVLVEDADAIDQMLDELADALLETVEAHMDVKEE